MSYSRWSHSDWYVYEHVNGGLQVEPCAFLLEEGEAGINLSVEDVRSFLSGVRWMDSMPGWKRASCVSKRELLWILREYIAEESGENLYEPFPNMRQMLRKNEKPQDDKDTECLK